MTRTSFRFAAALVAVLGLGAVRHARAAEAAGPQPDAQMLLDLDLLKETDLAKDRGFLTRMRMLERMRLLESLPALESQTQSPPPPKEVKSP